MNITSDFNFLNTKKTWNKVKTNNKKCKYIDDISNKKEAAIEYIAKLNVPALPKKDNKEIVLGTTKYLLPYYILTDYFITFAFDINIYTEQLNTILIDCIGNGYFNSIGEYIVISNISENIDLPEGTEVQIISWNNDKKYIIKYPKDI